MPSMLLAILAVSAAAAPAIDWPQWGGPDRDSRSSETGLLKEWPKDGPPLEWKASGLGPGFSTVSVAGDRLFTMGDKGKDQFAIALERDGGKEVWRARVGANWGDGPRCTPSVAGGLVYAIGTHGDLVCVAAADGKEKWRKNLGRDFGGKMMSGWGYSESSLIDGDRLICTPGAKDAMLVALDRKTGKTIWKCAVPDLGPKGNDGAAYSSIVVSEACGVRQYVQLVGRGVIGVAAADGRFLWGYNKVANNVANITTPVAKGDLVFATTSYDTGSALLRIAKDGDGLKAEEVYFLKAGTFNNHHGGVVLIDGAIYGGHGQNQGFPKCVDLESGKIVWSERGPGGGSAAILYAEGRLYFRFDDGVVALIEATRDGYKLRGSFTPPGGEGPAWPHPVIADGKLYLRRGDLLLCYDVKAR